MMNSKNLIVYHQVKPGIDCPDGICSAWVTSESFMPYQSDFELIGGYYLNNKAYKDPSFELPYDPAGKNVYLLDFSYPKQVLERILERSASLTILDHHETRMADISTLTDRVLGGYSEDECGATFAWKYFFPDAPQPWFLKHVRRRDTGADGYYEGQTPDSEAINLVISELRQGKVGFQSFPVFDRLCQSSEEEIIKKGMPKIEERNNICQKVIDEAVKANLFYEVGDHSVPLVQVPLNAAKHYSIIGATYCLQYKSTPFVVLKIEGDESSIYLRSRRGGTDVSKIALSMGGGGHRNAAGFVFHETSKITAPC